MPKPRKEEIREGLCKQCGRRGRIGRDLVTYSIARRDTRLLCSVQLRPECHAAAKMQADAERASSAALPSPPRPPSSSSTARDTSDTYAEYAFDYETELENDERS